ncbi:hypothetical protein K3495_g15024 [Podosphaera aphanis]|nr:hypothetical protein K3495_g15024 [Podosphaera aphanis]
MGTPIINRVVLKDGVSFANWRGDLRAELSRADVLGHIFHDIEGIDPEIEPTEPKFSKSEPVENFEKAKQEYKVRRRAWIRGEIEAQNIIIQRLDDSKKPHDYHRYTAKQLYEMIARSNQVTNLLPHSEAFDAFISTKFTTTAEEYCTTFLQNLQNVNNASESLSPSNSIAANFRLSDELASVFFVKGTRHVKWLDIWRETKAVNMF